MRYVWNTSALLILLPCLSGCHHKPVVPPLPKITEPVDMAATPPPTSEPLLETPVVRLPPVPYAAAGGHYRREKRRRPQPAVNAVAPPLPATTPAETAAPDVASIGALSSGGDASPRAQQEAAGLIAANDRRINGLPVNKVEAEKTQLSQVRNFQRQAQEALASGDTEGAKTLATKAKLLLDDIEKL